MSSSGPVLHLIGATVLSFILIVGCDPSVDVVTPSDQYQYSLFGVLDVNRDTQFIRVEPLGDTTQVGAPSTLDATVHLQNLETGTRVTLQDSFDTIVGGQTTVHNAWTTHDIQPATPYRITVRRDSTPITTATTTTPAQGPAAQHTQAVFLPCRSTEAQNTTTIRFEHPDQVNALEAIYPMYRTEERNRTTRPSFDHLRAPLTSGEFPIHYGDDLRDLYDPQAIGEQDTCLPRSRLVHDYVLVATALGGPDWPDWLGVPLNDIARPDTFSNVEGGHGFVGGVHTDTLRIPVLEPRSS